jgi:hypothetical protein
MDSLDLASQTDLHSATQAKLLFKWLIHPMPVEEFYEKYWEKRPLVIKRKSPQYYDGWYVELACTPEGMGLWLTLAWL